MRRAPIVIAVVCVVATAASLVIFPPTEYSERSIALLFSTFALAFVIVGALLAVARPENAVGRIMLAIGAVMTVPVVTAQYAGYALLVDTGLPAGRAMAWLSTFLYVLVLGLMTILLLVFPGGRLETRRRRRLAVVAAVSSGVAAVAQAFLPGPMDGYGTVRNPLGIEAAEAPLQAVLGVSAIVAGLAFLAAAVSVFARLRSARGDEREQLKWFAYAAALLVVCQLPNVLPLGVDSSLLGLVLVVVALTALPVAVAVAVLKYRLYDIDVVINRTLVYGALTATLGAFYLASVLLVSLAVGESGFAVAVSTLAVAGLFRPARARIQDAVDRRFYRRRYDAGQTLEAFGGRLRDELDLETLGDDLRGVVGETLQPAHVTLWLRSAP